MKTYITRYGDTWDSLALELFGDEFMADTLMEMQSEDVLDYAVLPEGLKIKVPDKSDTEVLKYFRAPWSK